MDKIEDDGLAPIEEAYSEDETAPEENVIAVETAGLPLLFPARIAPQFPKDRCVAVHARNVYMGCNASNRWVPDGLLTAPVGSQSILRREVGKFCDAYFLTASPPPKDAKKDYRNVLFTTRFREDLLKEVNLPSLEADTFNADPMLLGFHRGMGGLSGVIDLATKKTCDMQPGMFITNKLPAAPDWDMKTPTFDKFLPAVLSGEKDRCGYLLRYLGYALTGLTGEDTLTFLLGSGGNGKSTLIDLLTFIFGRHYCLNRRMSVLLEKRGESNDDAQKRLNAHLYSKRLFLADEANKNMRFDQAQLKSLSTTSRLSGALLYENEMTFQSSHKIVISLDKPPVLEGTKAMLRRLHLIEFRESFPVDRTLLPALKREGPGVLAKLIDSCWEWQRDGLCPPASVQAASKDILNDADIFGRWLLEKTEYAPGVDTARTVLQASYDQFRRTEGDQTAIKASEFTQLFRCDQRYDRAARPYVDGVQGRGIGNIRLKAEVEKKR